MARKLAQALFLLILLAGIAAGLYLVAQPQETRVPAAPPQQEISKVAPEAIQVPVLKLAYFPRDPQRPNFLDSEETGWGGNNWGHLTVDDWRQRTEQMSRAALPIINQATRYHGYKNPSAPQALNYFVVEFKEFFEPIPRGHPLGRNNFRPNYGGILRDLNICDWVDSQGVREVWMYGYHQEPGIVPDESKMSSRFGDISNGLPKEEAIAPQFRMPICGHSYVLYNFTYQPGGADAIGNNIHNRLHQVENVIPWVEGKWPPTRENVSESLFWGDFSEYVQSYTERNYLSSCGNSHYPPNWETQSQGYLYNLQNYKQNNCESWHPDESQTTYINANCIQWGCTEVGFYKWWMQNIPGLKNGIDYQGKKMRNWWEFIGDLDGALASGRSLFEEAAFILGDIDRDGDVDIFDYNLMVSHFGPRMPAGGTPADIDGDGDVDIFDYNILLTNFGR